MATTGNNYDRDVDIDLRQLGFALWRKKLILLIVAVAVAIVAFLATSTISPKYRSETRLLIESRESIFSQPTTGSNNPDNQRGILDREAMSSQVEIIRSSDLLRQVALELDLASVPEFDPSADLSIVSRLLMMVGAKEDPFLMPPDMRVLKELSERIEVYLVENSRVLVISASSKSPELAAKIPNAIASAYLGLQRDAKLATNVDAAAFLQPEIAELKERVRRAEERVAQYRGTADILLGQNQSSLATQQLSELSSELSRVRANRSSAEATAATIRNTLSSGGSLEALPSIISSPLIEGLRNRQAEIDSQIAEASTTLLDGHPRIKALRAQRQDLQQQVRSSVQTVLSSLNTQAETARLRESQLTGEVNRLKAESSRAEEQTVELRALEREADAERTLLEDYLRRYREASVRNDSSYVPADARVFSSAAPPSESYFPKKLPITMAAFIGSLMIGVIVVLMQELFSGRALAIKTAVPENDKTYEPSLNTERAVQANNMQANNMQTSAATLAQASPSLAPVEDLEALSRANLANAKSRMAEITPVKFRVPAVTDELIAGGYGRAIFITPDVGAGIAGSIEVAREMADQGVSVLLVDLTVAGHAGLVMLENDKMTGITDLMAQKADFGNAIHPDLYSDAHIVPKGVTNSALAMRNAAILPELFAAMAAAYDMVLIDCGPASAEQLEAVFDENAVQAFVIAGERLTPDLQELAQGISTAFETECMFVAPKARLNTQAKPRSVVA